MEKITFNIDKVALTKALILWNTGMDGKDGATCQILEYIPWDANCEKYMSWVTEVNPRIVEAIGGRDVSFLPDHFIENTLTRFIGNTTSELDAINFALLNLTEWAKRRADNIIETYNNIIAELNKRIEEAECVYGMIEKFVGVDSKGFAKYEKVILIKDKNTDAVINRLWMIARGLTAANQWKEVSFNHWIRRETRISLGESYYCHLGDKVTNS